MADTKTDSSSTPLSDDPAIPTKGLSAKPNTASHPAGAEPALDTLFHRTSRDSGALQDADTGTFLHVPRGVVHNFKNETEQDARMLIWFAPAGIEKMFNQIADDPDRFREIGAAYGVEYVTDP